MYSEKLRNPAVHQYCFTVYCFVNANNVTQSVYSDHIQSHCFKHVDTLLSVPLTYLLQSFVFVSTSDYVLTV